MKLILFCALVALSHIQASSKIEGRVFRKAILGGNETYQISCEKKCSVTYSMSGQTVQSAELPVDKGLSLLNEVLNPTPEKFLLEKGAKADAPDFGWSVSLNGKRYGAILSFETKNEDYSRLAAPGLSLESRLMSILNKKGEAK